MGEILQMELNLQGLGSIPLALAVPRGMSRSLIRAGAWSPPDHAHFPGDLTCALQFGAAHRVNLQGEP